MFALTASGSVASNLLPAAVPVVLQNACLVRGGGDVHTIIALVHSSVVAAALSSLAHPRQASGACKRDKENKLTKTCPFAQTPKQKKAGDRNKFP